MTRETNRSSVFATLAGLVVLAAACTSAPVAPEPASGTAPSAPTAVATSTLQATSAPAVTSTARRAAATNTPPSTQTMAAAPRPTVATSAAAPAGQAGTSCKVAQVYTSPTATRAGAGPTSSRSLSVKKDLPWVDLSIRKDSVPDDNKQAVEDLLESMVQQGARSSTRRRSGSWSRPAPSPSATRTSAFFHASGFPRPRTRQYRLLLRHHRGGPLHHRRGRRPGDRSGRQHRLRRRLSRSRRCSAAKTRSRSAW